MSRGLNNSEQFRTLRDYGSTSNSANITISGGNGNNGGGGQQGSGGAGGSGSGNNNGGNGGSGGSNNNSGSGNGNTVPDVNFAGFSPTEFISLSENIAQSIQAVKTSWQILEKANKIIGTPKDNQTTREKM